jgi:hypothetical protein
MLYLRVLTLLSLLFLLTFCSNNERLEQYEHPRLLFSSGFENDVEIQTGSNVNYPGFDFITGEDLTTGYTWPVSILRSSSYNGLHYISDNNRQAVRSEIQIVRGHNGNMTKALFQEQNEAFQDDTACAYEIFDILDGTKDLYIRYWIKLDTAGMSQPDSWRQIFSYKTQGYDIAEGYRLSAYVKTDAQGIPYWYMQADNAGSVLWEIENDNLAVPVGEWFKMELFWHWSDGADGRTLWKINGNPIVDYMGATTYYSQPLSKINLWQISGNVNPKKQWIDDVQIWSSLYDISRYDRN